MHNSDFQHSQSFANNSLLKLYEIAVKPDEQKILETKIDPLDWRQEVEKVYGHLQNIEKELEIIIKQGSENDDEFDEFRRHLELVIELCEDIRESSHHEVRRVFSDSADFLEKQLLFIRKNEIRINRHNEAAITKLGQVAAEKKTLASELRRLIQRVKELDFNCKEVGSQILQIGKNCD